MRLKTGICSGCGHKKPIVNRKHMLCGTCNYLRTHDGKPVFGHKNSAKDRDTYRKVWESRPHECEECGCPLGEMFENEDDRLVDPFRYSHILGKDNYPEHRHDITNFNLLCLKDHNQWEFGKQEEMKIWEENQKTIARLTGRVS